jgi:hypothetical protein
MKIIFICGCLEPGKDGVGDYTRRLAGELIRQDIPVGMLSYNDTFVNNEVLEHQVSENSSITCLRLPTTWRGSKRSNHAKKWVQQNNPEWLSLQFVPYAFNKKGLPFGLGQQLNHMRGNAKWHIMFHELWIGMEIGSSKKDILIGFIQKQVIKRLGKKLKLQVVHTQTQLYQEQLKKIGIESELLPLFSNIPNEEKNIINKFTEDSLRLLIFGSIHHNAPVEIFLEEIASYALNNKIDVSLSCIGRNGRELESWIEICNLHSIDVKVFGEQPSEKISEVINSVSLGICTTPYVLGDKSGSVAAMIERGVPVICVSRKWQPRGFNNNFNSFSIIEYKEGNFIECVPKFKSFAYFGKNVSQVTLIFLNTLKLNDI